MSRAPAIQLKWTMDHLGYWKQVPMILTTHPFKETPASPGAANTGEGR